ncbi:Imm9 family immunity protein [Pseudomonas sp. FYR_11]|uniref:Imm9 family immunity protein n=1 Tax=Pseudomonas TaxID=286 RepID=UPI00370CB47F
MHPSIRCAIHNESPKTKNAIDLFEIMHTINNHITHELQKINTEDLNDWNILILVTIRNTNTIGVFKHTRRYPSDKELELSISIPVPNEEQAPYGLPPKNSGFFFPIDEKKAHTITPEYLRYDDLREYIIESIKSAIAKAFEIGITFHGRKIQFSKTQK